MLRSGLVNALLVSLGRLLSLTSVLTLVRVRILGALLNNRDRDNELLLE